MTAQKHGTPLTRRLWGPDTGPTADTESIFALSAFTPPFVTKFAPAYGTSSSLVPPRSGW